ncbi:hypothetical protein J7T55_010071 [Diaporthe amygdali]|uniref:uncharacterized protein n=1 Tax=Phomopsis amygdali TaxID=1214568 RepID=UPI0022FE1631|nr:uncharacterized protein J7T55_010071 [Diaporthe amygdali]KAJ0113827.1 hypothetical protein J7T55_010071 [Diaporthe amygdali]
MQVHDRDDGGIVPPLSMPCMAAGSALGLEEHYDFARIKNPTASSNATASQSPTACELRNIDLIPERGKHGSIHTEK